MNSIEIRALEKSYTGFDLKLDLCLPQGCIMGLIGENGAGKSTAMKLILGMTERDAGEICVLGHDNRVDFAPVKEDIGVVLDEPCFPDCLTARQVDKVMRGIYRKWDSAAFEAYLKEFSVPDNKSFKDFSRGMKMKLSIAVALSHDPKLLILDEPSSGLDPVVRDEVMDIFSEFTRDESHSILISSHIVSDLEKICDYIAFLHKGRLMLCEEKDRLLEEYGVLNCTEEEFDQLSPSAVLGRRKTDYGISAVVLRDAVPPVRKLSPISIEELFVFMCKGA